MKKLILTLSSILLITPLAYSHANHNPRVTSLSELKKEIKIDHSKPATLLKIKDAPGSTSFYMYIPGEVVPHKHKEHDEFFVLQKGQGTFYYKDDKGEIQSKFVQKGAIFHVPKGTEHAYYPEEDATIGVASYSPALTKPDRHKVDWGKFR